MFRTSDIVLIAIMVSSAAFTYKVKQDAEDQAATVQKLQAQIKYEEDTIDLLKADWSLLTQPSRLQKLADLYKDDLKLAPIEAHQIVSLDDIPIKPPPSVEEPDAVADGKKKDGKDHIATGSVTR